MAPLEGACFATLLMNDGYLPGAMVLGHSLRDRGAKGKLVAFVVIERLAQETLNDLRTIYDDVVPVPQLVNAQPANLYLMGRPDLVSTFTKIELWRQLQYKRIVYLDADMVALRAPNELLTLDTHFAAAPDVGWPDCFNSGMMVLNPNMQDYYALLALAKRGISFDGADQGLLNMHFTNWERLSFAYNCTPSANYQYIPAYRHFQSTISMVHFIGADKPWTLGRDTKQNHGVFGELLGRWWAVYDAHYRQQKQELYTGPKVQDYVRGEETIFTSTPIPTSFHGGSNPSSAPASAPSSVPGIQVTAPSEDNHMSMERPFGDQPDVADQLDAAEMKPVPTIEQRRWSAPHAEWEPSKQPPPANSKPEAANFPTQVYEMSVSRDLFEPPTSYPEPPKDMWYKVPEKVAPVVQPKPIFPWETHAPKATRVFPKSREPSPPPPPSVPQPTPAVATTAQSDIAAVSEALSSISGPPREPSPPKLPAHVFPWEARAPKPTRVFPSYEPPPPPEPISGEIEHEREPQRTGSAVTDATTTTADSVPTPSAPESTWDSFQQRGNAWDEMPEIAKYMEALTRPRKAKIQVLHHTPSENITQADDVITSPTEERRRPSLKLTDFPTEVERPSLPVTPAPIRRPTFWNKDQDEVGDLPQAEGVPKQEQWVRRFLSYPSPFPLSRVSQIDGIIHFQCQHCGEQNPIAKLEELQRRQNEILSDDSTLERSKTPPQREMPESQSKEEAVEAAQKALEPKPIKPILKAPSFEVSDKKDEDLLDDNREDDDATPTNAGTKTPPRFNPIVIEGEAASEKKDPSPLISPTPTA